MTDHDQQLERLREAVARKSEAAREASREHPEPAPAGEDDPSQGSRLATSRPQDVLSPRDKNSGKGKKTADKWNQ